MFWSVLGALVVFGLLLVMPVAVIGGLIGFWLFDWIGAGILFLLGLAVSFDA